MKPNNGEWLTLMYEILRYTKQKLGNPELMTELAGRLKEQKVESSLEMFKLARPEIAEACELLVPGLMFDFLASNPELLNQAALSEWASQKDRQRGL